VQSQWIRRSTLKKHNNSPKKSEPTWNRAKSRGLVQLDPKEVLAELLEKLKEKLDSRAVAASAGEEHPRGELRPNFDRLTVGVDLGDQWSPYCILGLEGEALAEGQLRTTPQDVTEFFEALNAARVVVEVGTHSAWVREVICGYGHEVLVANPRLMEGSKRRNCIGLGLVHADNRSIFLVVGSYGFSARMRVPAGFARM
jgi:hypothetical protein